MHRRMAIVLLLFGLTSFSAAAASSRIVKVLPHLLDKQGRNTVAPSLFARDAYQAHLRQHPEEQGGLRFDVQWKSKPRPTVALRLRLEARGSKDPKPLSLDRAVEPPPWYGRWTALHLDQPTFARIGEIVAWRVTLWDGERLLAEQHSFLW